MKSISRKVLREDAAPHPIIVAIRQVCESMDAVENRFKVETDPDLIEACVYEMQSLRAKYRYFLRLARSSGIASEERAYLWDE